MTAMIVNLVLYLMEAQDFSFAECKDMIKNKCVRCFLLNKVYLNYVTKK